MLALVCMLAAAASPAKAQESARTLEKVVVTAGRTEEKAANVTQAMTVIPAEEIERNQYQDLGQLLRHHGVSVPLGSSANEAFSQITIRGQRNSLFGDGVSGKVLLLVDGRRAGTLNPSLIPMVSIERIEIIRGPAAVQYGTSAVGGVVNIILKRGGKVPHLTLEAGGGSWDTWKTQAGASGTFKALDFAGGVSWMTVGDDYKTGDGHTYPNTRLSSRVAYALNLGLNILEEHRVGVVLMGVNNDRAGNYGSLGGDWTYPHAYTDRNDHSVDLSYEGGYKDYGLNWKLRYYNAKHDYTWANPIAPSDMYNPSTNEANTQGTSGQLSWSRGIFTLTGGVEWLNNEYNTSTTPSKGKFDNIGTFFLVKAGLFDEKLILSGGLRYDDYTMKYQHRERDLDNTSFSVGVAYNPWDWLTFRANYGSSYLIPTVYQLTGYDNSGTVPYVGNPNLKPEKGLGWDVGFEVNYQYLNLGLTYFQIDYKDAIGTRSLPSYEQEWYNIAGTAKYRGIEAQASMDMGEFFNWPVVFRPYVNLTRLFTYKDNEGKPLQNIRSADVAYGVSFQYPSIGLDADLRFLYFGHQTEQDYNTPWPYQTKYTGGFTTADFSISQRLWQWEDGGTLKVIGEVRNIFDRQYALNLGYPMPGRSFYLGLRYDY